MFLNKQTYYISFFLFCFYAHVVDAQITISGYIRDKTSGESLIGASVYELTTLYGTTTNSYGFYTLTIPRQDSLVLNYSYIGYRDTCVIISFGMQEVKKDILLLRGVSLRTIEIKASSESSKRIEEKNETSLIEIPIEVIKDLPNIGGEADIIKAFQLMPGISSAGEANANMLVRGGSPDQNMMLLDGVPLYYVSHLGGYASIFNSDAINNAVLIKGAFPARYGGRLSSIVDITMKEGNLNSYSGNITIAPLSSRLSFEGPLIKEKSSFIISVRRSMLDIITRPLSKIILNGTNLGYSFYDFNFKINHIINPRNRIFFSFYSGNDIISVKTKNESLTNPIKIKSGIDWGNKLAAFRWNHLFSNKISGI
jgi:hypothetical protein